MPIATSIQVDRERWCACFWRRRLTLSSVGPLIGRSDGWASQMAFKGHAGYYALDELAAAIGMHVEELIHEVGTDAERCRINVL